MDNLRVTSATVVKKRTLEILQRLPYIYPLHAVASLPLFGAWRKAHTSESEFAPSRRSFHEAIARKVAGEKIIYLEFGVYRGDSIRYWLQLNDNPCSRFVGFDTFTGLPETWKHNFGTMAQNTFDAGGVIPVVNDDRCSFRAGLFQENLRPFLKSLERTEDDRVILHMDADIYSATLFALCECDSILRTGDIIIFDEFANVFNEFRALEDWRRSYLRNYKVLYHTQWEDQVCLQLV